MEKTEEDVFFSAENKSVNHVLLSEFLEHLNEDEIFLKFAQRVFLFVTGPGKCYWILF